MALVGLPAVAALTTLEMTPYQYMEFRKHWILANAENLIWEGNVSHQVALITARNDFLLEEKTKTPFGVRNDTVRRNRRARRIAAGK